MVRSEAEANSTTLEGRKIVILARSTKDRQQKQAIGDLVTSMGGTISASVPKTARRIDQNPAVGPQTADLVIVGSADPKGYVRDLATHVRERGTEYDVLSAAWLEVCRERGRVVEPLPRHYKHVSDLSLERLIELDGYDQCATPPTPLNIVFAALHEGERQPNTPVLCISHAAQLLSKRW